MKLKKPTPARAVVAGIILVLSLALVPAAFASKSGGAGGKSGSGSTVSAPVMVIDNNGDGLPNWGDTITFNVSTTASTPSVQLNCYQNGAMLYTATRGFYVGYMWSDNYPLWNQYWTGGAATCTATLYSQNKNGSTTTLATLSFNVGA